MNRTFRLSKSTLGTFLILIFILLATACGNGNDKSGESSVPSPKAVASASSAASESAVASSSVATSESSVNETSTLESTEFSIGVGRDTQLSPLVVIAQEEGFFQEEGLNVKVELFATGPDVTAALASNSIQLGSSGDIPLLIANSAGAPIQAIARQADISGVQTLVVNPDKIKTPEDLNGKKIAYVPGTVTEALFLKIVEKYKLDAGSITSVKTGPTEILPAYQNGNVDAFIIWQPLALKGVEAGGVKLLTANESFVPGQEGAQKLVGSYSLLAGNKDFLADNPNTVKAVLRAVHKAAEFIRTQTDQAAADVSKSIGQEIDLVKQIIPLNEYSLDITPELAQTLEEISTFLLNNGKIKAAADLSDFLDTSFLEEVNGASVTWAP